MKRDRIDRLLQLAFLEGAVTTHGLYEIALAKKKGTVKATAASRTMLETRLAAALAARVQPTEMSFTVGMYLGKIRSDQRLRPEEVAPRLGVSTREYRMLEEDRLSPLKVPVDKWKRIQEFFRVTAEDLCEMIRRTHQLVWFKPAFRLTLARYDSRKNRARKAPALEDAARELYAKATLSLPADEERKLQALFRSLKEN